MSQQKPSDPWIVFDYEWMMFSALYGIFKAGGVVLPVDFAVIFGNAFTESLLLHMRQLCDITLGTHFPNDVKVNELIGDRKLLGLAELQAAYDCRLDEDGSPRDVLNKKLAHPDRNRTSEYDYDRLVRLIGPILEKIGQEILGSRNLTN